MNMKGKTSDFKAFLQDSPERCFKQPTISNAKSEKVLKILKSSPDSSKPFKRKQQPNHNNYYTNNVKKNKFEDIGKLISNTSFGSNTDILRIVSTSPQQCLKGKQPHQFVIQDNNYNKGINKNTESGARQVRSSTHLEAFRDTSNQISLKLLTSLQNNSVRRRSNENGLHLSIQKQRYPQSRQLKQKVQRLLQKCSQLQVKILELQQKLKQKQDQINTKCEQLLKQKQMTRCLEDIILQLNRKIKNLLVQQYSQSDLLMEIQNYQKKILNSDLSIQKQIQMERQKKLNRFKSIQQSKQILEQRQKIYTLTRMVHSLQVQNLIGKKIRAELEKQKESTKYLQKQNKALKQRIMVILKSRKPKNKLSLKKQLEYSISYSFQSKQ